MYQFSEILNGVRLIYHSEASTIRYTKTLLIITFMLGTLAFSSIVVIPPVSAKRSTLTFTGTQSFVQFLELGSEQSAGQTIQIRGRIDVHSVETSSTLVDGLITRFFSANSVLGKNTQLWGTFTLDTDEGQWEGTWRGTISADGSEVNTYMGHGIGALEGYIIRYLFDSSQTLNIRVTISMPRGA